MQPKIFTLIALVVVFFNSSIVSAQEVKPTPTPVPITVTRAWLQGNQGRSDAGFRDRILVEVEHLTEAVQKDKINPRDFVLYLNGQALKGVKVKAIEGPKQNWLAFDLERTPESDQAWRSLLGSPWSSHRQVGASVGLPDKQAIPQSVADYWPMIYLRLYYPRWVVICSLVLILLVFLFVRRAKKGGFIHDSNPPNPATGAQKPYSLALTQVAWWFFLVIGSFVFIYMITGDYNTVTNQALILMGIGTGTALGAFMINATKRDTADSQLSALRPDKAKLAAEIDQLAARESELKAKIQAAGAAATTEDQLALRDNAVVLKEKQAKLDEVDNQINQAESGLSKPVSESFIKDLLTDVNGITLHRFQMLIWTVVLGVIFCIGVYRNLAMPEFSVTLLALMGISAGTYLGFKIPERQQ